MIKKLKLPKFEKSSFKRFLATYKKILKIAFEVNPRLLIIITIINSVWGLTNLPVLYINKLLIDTVIANIGNPDLNNAFRIIVLFIAIRAFIEFLRSALTRFNGNLTQIFTNEIDAHLDRRSAAKLNTLDIPTIESPEFQDKYKKIQRESRNRLWGMISPLSDLPNAFFTIVSGAIPLFSFSPWIWIVVVVVTIPDILVNTRLAKKDYEAMELMSPKWRVWTWVLGHMTDSRHYYENKILGNTAYLGEKLKRVQNEILVYQRERRLRRAKWRTLALIPQNLLSLILNAYFFLVALMGRITLGTAQMLYQSTTTLANGFSTLVNDAVSIYENYLFVSDLDWFLRLKSSSDFGNRSIPKVLTKGIEFKNVWFKYPKSKKWILKGINFKVAPAESLALVGENGAGKTTTIKLLAGFYKPTKGEILIDGVNIYDYQESEYGKLLSVLFQDFSRYPFTAKESIGISDVSSINDLNSIKKYAKMVGIHEFIEGLALKYENPLAKEFDKGVEPSKGQWQRIALARILFKDARILILDEPTSNVDPESENEIFEKITKLAKEKILILISHRFSTVKKADQIIVINKGEIVERGTHSELMTLNGSYSKLFKLQAKAYGVGTSS